MFVQQSERERGSVMVLVVVATVLLAILGISYMQVVRAQRAHVPQTQGDIEAVKRAIIYQILRTLTDDVMDSEGRFLSQSSNIVDGVETGRDEPYDYPWTNHHVQHSVFTPLGNTFNNAHGGAFDDRWLADVAPIVDDPNTPGTHNSTARWRHITNLNGYWVLLPDPAGTETLPREVVARVGGSIDSRSNELYIDHHGSFGGLATQLSGYLPIGGDASGDGILDSRWTWAPLAQVNGVAYVMTVRIVDLSAKTNAAVALSMTDASGTFDVSPSGLHAPRWWFPSELDLSGSVWEVAQDIGSISTAGNFPTPGQAMEELRGLLAFRGLMATHRTPWGTTPFAPGHRGDFWLNGAALYNNPHASYGISGAPRLNIDDELALRWREGLKRDGYHANIELQMPGFLRDEPTSVESAWHHAMTNMGVVANQQTYYNYYRHEPRNQLTVLSGASIYAPRLPDLTTAPTHNNNALDNDPRRVVKRDINQMDMLELSREIRKVLERGNFVMPTGVASYLVQLGIDPDSPQAREFLANQLAVNVHDYGDENNVIRVFEPVTGGRRYYGMEALPFLAEVYVQRRYKAVTSEVTPPTSPITYNVTWEAEGNTGYAIEIRNPFRHPISLSNVYLFVDGLRVHTATDNPDSPDDLVAISGVTHLDVDEVLVLYRDSNDGAEDEDDVRDLIDNTGNVRIVDLETRGVTFNWPDASGTGAVNVELRAKETQPDGTEQPGEIFPWAYSAAEAEPMPQSFDAVTPVVEPDPANVISYRQHSFQGNGNRLNVLTVAPNEFERTSKEAIAHPNDASEVRNQTLDKLGEETKNGPADKVNRDANQLLIADRGTFAGGEVGPILHVGELLQIAALAPLEISPSNVVTVGDAWGSAGNIERFMLDPHSTEWIDPTASDTPGNANYDPNVRINHALFLLERLTTMSPLEDGEDNDGDGSTTNDEETFIPGVVNLNTATYETLVRVLPITNPTLRANVARRIVEFRDETTRDPRRAHRFNDVPRQSLGGIAYVTELWEELVPLFRDPPYVGADVSNIDGVRVDFTANPSDSTADGIRDDREEEMMVFNWLLQTCTTRSDRYVAYVLIHGYPAGDFRNNGDGPLESLRFYFVIDRSNLVDETSIARMLGLLEVQ